MGWLEVEGILNVVVVGLCSVDVVKSAGEWGGGWRGIEVGVERWVGGVWGVEWGGGRR